MEVFFHFPNSVFPYHVRSSSSSSSPSDSIPYKLITVHSSILLSRHLHSQAEKLCHLLSTSGLQINEFFCGRTLKRGRPTIRRATWLDFFSENDSSEKDFAGKRRFHPDTSHEKKPFNGRLCTNILLGLNVLVYIAQVASEGRLMFMGAKVNSLITQGQIWRLATSAFLHGNLIHLLVNCYSLNSIGPPVEMFSGSKRFMTVYLTSAIASSLASYRFCQSPSVGASGAIFGLVGSLALFVLRHRNLVNTPNGDLLQIGQVILLNLFIGLATPGIDNWGHVGGLVGGIGISWLLGPSLRFGSGKDDRRRRIIIDEAPIFRLIKRK
ncbi:Rhomboid-like protein [Zostera marina]|uniref:Rhomboid-like protein n=1 Tax=Zostera marina TaxID=29655 RepID=A0A0K9PHN4_ZOSMR|nr:Rhomboid-like protein [Zostera marina]